MQHQTHLVGNRATATGAVRRQLALVQLDQVFRLAAGAVEGVIKPFGAAARHVGHYVTDNNTASGIIHAYVYGVAATGSLSLTNSGTITSQLTGVDANNATVINMSGGLIEGEFAVGVRLGGNTATLVNAGTISGGSAVYLQASASNILVVGQGAVFDGIVQAGGQYATNGIYLAAGTTGTLAGLGTNFTGFQTVTIGEAATWQIAGSAASLGTTTIDGFRPGDTLDFTGLAFTGRGPGYITGESVQVDAATGMVSIIEAQNLSSSGVTLATAQFGSVLANEGFNVVSDGHGGTLLEQTGPMNAAISTQGLGGIVLATGSVYASILTITTTGSAADQGVVSGQTVNINYGIQALEGASITNAGSVSGYQDGIYLTQGGTISNLAGGTLQGVNGSGIDIAGGVGIVLNSGLIEGTTGATMAAGGTLTNDAGGTITGRLFGIELGPQTSGLPILVNEGLVKCTSATSVELTGGGFVYNEPTGVITGGAITGTDFGVLAVNDFAKVTNCGTISGGTGIDLTAGGFVVNESGTIKGGVVVSGGIGYLSSCGSISGVNGVAFSNGGTIVNSAAGTIIGTSGYGVSLGSASASASDDVKNSGLIECATYGAILSGATTTLFNAGTIAAINGGDAVQLDGSTTNKLQLAAGFVFVGDVIAKSGAANSIELTASATAGVLSGLGTSLQGFSAVTLDSGAAWTIETTAAEAGKISFSGQSANDTLALTGGGTLGTNVSGFGTLLLDAPGTFTIGSNAIPGDQVIAVGAGAVLDINGGGSFAGALTGTGTLVIGARGLTLSSGACLSAAHVVQTGNIILASDAITNAAEDTYTMTAAAGRALLINRTGTGSNFTNAGTLVANGAGTAEIAATFTDNGTASVTAGTLLLQHAGRQRQALGRGGRSARYHRRRHFCRGTHRRRHTGHRCPRVDPHCRRQPVGGSCDPDWQRRSGERCHHERGGGQLHPHRRGRADSADQQDWHRQQFHQCRHTGGHRCRYAASRDDAAPGGILGARVNAAAGVDGDLHLVSGGERIERCALHHDLTGNTRQNNDCAARCAQTIDQTLIRKCCGAGAHPRLWAAERRQYDVQESTARWHGRQEYRQLVQGHQLGQRARTAPQPLQRHGATVRHDLLLQVEEQDSRIFPCRYLHVHLLPKAVRSGEHGAAVDIEHSSGRVGAGKQSQRRAGDAVGIPHEPGRQARRGVGVHAFARSLRHSRIGSRSLDQPWRDDIDAHGCQFHRQRPAERLDGAVDRSQDRHAHGRAATVGTRKQHNGATDIGMTGAQILRPELALHRGTGIGQIAGQEWPWPDEGRRDDQMIDRPQGRKEVADGRF